MINIRLVPTFTNETQLALQFRDLDFPQNQYEGFRMLLFNDEISTDWADLDINDSTEYESSVYIFDNLKENHFYRVIGKYKINGEWHDAIGSHFAPHRQLRRPNIDIETFNKIVFKNQIVENNRKLYMEVGEVIT